LQAIAKANTKFAELGLKRLEKEAKHLLERKNKDAKTVIIPGSILQHAQELRQTLGIRGKDALHLACAVKAGCDYFLTTDHKLIKKTRNLGNLVVINPVHFVEFLEETDDGENGNPDTL
jgi:predicted nucleic acid-binding protein